MKHTLILPAGGTASRFGGQKLLAKLQKKTVIEHTLDAFSSFDCFHAIIIPAHPTLLEKLNSLISVRSEKDKIKLIPGGETRQESIQLGLDQCADCDYVWVHDAARPNPSHKLIQQLLNLSQKHPAIIPCISVTDSIKEVFNKKIIAHPERQGLKAAQTPQVFQYSLLKKAYQNATRKTATDDATLVSAYSEIHTCEGEASNLKITAPIDLTLLELILDKNTA